MFIGCGSDAYFFPAFAQFKFPQNFTFKDKQNFKGYHTIFNHT